MSDYKLKCIKIVFLQQNFTLHLFNHMADTNSWPTQSQLRELWCVSCHPKKLSSETWVHPLLLSEAAQAEWCQGLSQARDVTAAFILV